MICVPFVRKDQKRSITYFMNVLSPIVFGNSLKTSGLRSRDSMKNSPGKMFLSVDKLENLTGYLTICSFLLNFIFGIVVNIEYPQIWKILKQWWMWNTERTEMCLASKNNKEKQFQAKWQFL